MALHYILLSKWNKMQCMNYRMDIVFFLSHQCHQIYLYIYKWQGLPTNSAVVGNLYHRRLKKSCEFCCGLSSQPYSFILLILFFWGHGRLYINCTLLVQFQRFCSALIECCFLNVHFLETANYLIKTFCWFCNIYNAEET